MTCEARGTPPTFQRGGTHEPSTDLRRRRWHFRRREPRHRPEQRRRITGATAVDRVDRIDTLTNLAHLDFLTDTVTPPSQPGHTTYRLDSEPAVGVLWVYANHLDNGTYERTGGGAYDAVHNTYGQGAFDADDLARAAVVYLRHWTQFGDPHSRGAAYQLLRGLTYLQTATGPNAGNVVLWMQPDGSLNPSPTPADTPNPSDSGAAYWLARTIWALGEGYSDLRDTDPNFASFLKDRLDLAIGALNREVLIQYGHYQLVDGVRMPAWLVTGGADASSEAVLRPGRLRPRRWRRNGPHCAGPTGQRNRRNGFRNGRHLAVRRDLARDDNTVDVARLGRANAHSVWPTPPPRSTSLNCCVLPLPTRRSSPRIC